MAGVSIQEHLKHMKELTDQIAAVGAAISEEDQVVTRLGSLPASYNTLFTAIEARIDDLTLEFVQPALINEEQKRHHVFIMAGGIEVKKILASGRKLD